MKIAIKHLSCRQFLIIDNLLLIKDSLFSEERGVHE